jgi:precorrin-6B methylase 2
MTYPGDTPNPTAGGLYQGAPDPSCPGLEIPGWMTETEMRWLHAQAREMGSIVEIGSLIGRSSAALLSGCKGPVYCIDCWTGDNASGKQYFLANVGHYPNLHMIHDYAHNVVNAVPDVDMTFIDGEHTLKAVAEDVRDWFPKTRVLLCGHDYGHPDYPGVKDLIDSAFEGRFAVAPGTSIWYVEIL